jgi:SAM-dependent methyltransferase
MDIDYYAKYFAFESEDWWFKGRRRIVLGLLSDALGKGSTTSCSPPPRIIDAGAGTGITLGHLSVLGSAIGVDESPEAIRFCRLRGHRDLVRADLSELGLRAACADVVTCLDVIEHIADDAAALREVHRVCKPDGVLVLTVPAFPFLWSEHDVINHHRRRYRKSELNALVRSAGFVIELSSFYNFWLSPLAVCVRLVKRLWTVLFPKVVGSITSDNTYLPRSINWLFATLFGSELALLRRGPLPFGISLVCVARKPGTSAAETARLRGAEGDG